MPNPSFQSEAPEEKKAYSAQPVNLCTAFVTRSQLYQPSMDRELTSLAANAHGRSSSQGKVEESPMTGQQANFGRR